MKKVPQIALDLLPLVTLDQYKTLTYHTKCPTIIVGPIYKFSRRERSFKLLSKCWHLLCWTKKSWSFLLLYETYKMIQYSCWAKPQKEYKSSRMTTSLKFLFPNSFLGTKLNFFGSYKVSHYPCETKVENMDNSWSLTYCWTWSLCFLWDLVLLLIVGPKFAICIENL